ncbi:intracellular growth attenuator protein IgaA [Leminorella grimontii]|uniref:Intracellular growth attenuator protein IgaA n=2 Tax=Leminorella grimontii TaxID=82981 RepID=A0AAV5N1H0_9GAMM|nr:intracellular growth attenuator protein IgaA [Leminorella grimontii]GKX59348.1 intracellular growth attenuator protein IgaA [Leminorella grimontii]
MRQRVARHRPSDNTLPFVHNSTRKLSAEEIATISEYLEHLENKTQDGALRDVIKTALTPYSDNVYEFESPVTSLPDQELPDGYRHYVHGIEVYLEPEWSAYIKSVNRLELIKTQTTPLILSLNGLTLADFIQSKRASDAERDRYPNHALHKKSDGSENVELIRLRKETEAESALKPKQKLFASLVIAASYGIFFCSLVSPIELLPWLVIIAVLTLCAGLWHMFRRSPKAPQYNIHCLRGVPKRWGLFGESDNGQLTNISVGTIDLVYPPHWQPYVGYDLDRKTNIDIYLNRYVVRQGKFLSLHNESINFPLHHWGKNLALAAASLMVILLLLSAIPLKLPLELTKAWFKHPTNVSVSSPEELKAANIKIGDHLTIKGNGMCSLPTVYQSDVAYPFMPFDCTQMYWGASNLPELPSSNVIDRAIELLYTIDYQLNPLNDRAIKNNPDLARNAERAGMTLVPNFPDIVLKTDRLCKDPGDCQRFKKSLLSLAHEKEWEELVKKSQQNPEQEQDLFVRPVVADSLRSQVNTLVSTFFYSQTHQAAQSLYNKPSGGFYLLNDSGKEQMLDKDEIASLMNPDIPLDTLYNNTAIKQWFELKRLSSRLMHVPFNANGIVIGISKIENQTTQITLHSESSLISFWRYLGASLLFIIMGISLLYNAALLFIRLRKNAQRIPQIQSYYDRCFAKSFRQKVQHS